MDPLIAARLVVRDAGGADSIAPHLGKSADTLRHELNPNDRTAKLGLQDAVTITQVAKDLRILTAFASECGAMVVPLPAVADNGDGSVEAVAKLAREFGDYLSKVSEAVSDGRVTDNELQRCERELGEMVQAAQQLQALIAALNRAAKPQALRAA